MGRLIAITNQKGGVGKTTLSVSLAAGLGRAGKRALLIDLDSQGNASAANGLIIENGERTVKDLFMKDHDPRDYIVSTDSIEIIPSNNSLKDIEDHLIKKSRYNRLKDFLDPIKNEYDYILMDCPPSINIFTKNALVAADEIIIPVDVGYFPLLGMKQLLEDINYIKMELNPHLSIRGILACKYDRRTILSDQILETLKNNFPGQVFKTVIRVNVDIVRSQIAQKNIFQYNPKSAGAEDFSALIEELVNG